MGVIPFRIPDLIQPPDQSGEMPAFLTGDFQKSLAALRALCASGELGIEQYGILFGLNRIFKHRSGIFKSRPAQRHQSARKHNIGGDGIQIRARFLVIALLGCIFMRLKRAIVQTLKLARVNDLIVGKPAEQGDGFLRLAHLRASPIKVLAALFHFHRNSKAFQIRKRRLH